MCVLCWQFLTENHWTDRQFEDNDSTTATAGSDHERARRRDRHHRTRVLNQILTHYGLRLDDWHSRSYLLSDRKGKTAIVQISGRALAHGPTARWATTLIRLIPGCSHGSVTRLLYVSQAYEPHHHTTDHHRYGVSRERQDDPVAPSPGQPRDA